MLDDWKPKAELLIALPTLIRFHVYSAQLAYLEEDNDTCLEFLFMIITGFVEKVIFASNKYAEYPYMINDVIIIQVTCEGSLDMTLFPSRN